MKTSIKKQIQTSMDVILKMLNDEALLAKLEEAAMAVTDAYNNKGKTLLAGNGGSAADAQHIAAEFVNRFCFDRPALASIALTTDTSVITAISNDSTFDNVFERQIRALGASGDIFIGISTSGNSKNIIRALEVCREMGIMTIGLTGSKGTVMDSKCDICIKVPSDDTPRIQEAHGLIGHILCNIVEEKLFGHLKPGH